MISGRTVICNILYYLYPLLYNHHHYIIILLLSLLLLFYYCYYCYYYYFLLRILLFLLLLIIIFVVAVIVELRSFFGLRFRFDPRQRTARCRPVRRRHGPADLPGRGTVVLDELAGAASGPDDHLVQQ